MKVLVLTPGSSNLKFQVIGTDADQIAKSNDERLCLSDAYAHPDWARKAIVNIGSSGTFSSDRTIKEYAVDIWKVGPVQ
jgi:glucan phosphorylase